jgi:hypothetical protein
MVYQGRKGNLLLSGNVLISLRYLFSVKPTKTTAFLLLSIEGKTSKDLRKLILCKY